MPRPARPAVSRAAGAGAAAAVVLSLLAAGCLNDRAVVERPEPAAVAITPGLDYGAGHQLDVLAPAAPGPWPVAVLVHGCCGGREDLFQLAHELAGTGVVVFNAGWEGVTSTGAYQRAYAQVGCAVGFARAEAHRFGGDPGRVALVGWSDGAMPAARVALAPLVDATGCPTGGDPAQPDALVGISGYYGWPPDTDPFAAGLVNERTVAFFGGTPDAAPASWRDGNPYASVGAGPKLPVLLLAGEEHALLPDATGFHDALIAAGNPARLAVVADAGRQELILPRSQMGRVVVAEIVALLRSGSVDSG